MSEKTPEQPKKRIGRPPTGRNFKKVSVASSQRTLWRLKQLKSLQPELTYSQVISVGLSLIGDQIAGSIVKTGIAAPLPPEETLKSNKAPLSFHIHNDDLAKIDTYVFYWEASSSWIVSHAIRLVYEMAKGVWKRV